jgi:hypothetical protein
MFQPQHFTVPPVSRAHECSEPIAMLVAVVIPETETGMVSKEPAEPVPSLPLPLEPQHFIVPPVSRAHECESPRAMLVAVVIPDTETGVVRWVVVPSPSSPLPLEPQHFTVPPVSTAHECPPPREMLVAVVIPETATGVRLLVVVSSPRRPRWLLPQHFIVPSVSRAHEW